MSKVRGVGEYSLGGDADSACVALSEAVKPADVAAPANGEAEGEKFVNLEGEGGGRSVWETQIPWQQGTDKAYNNRI